MFPPSREEFLNILDKHCKFSNKTKLVKIEKALNATLASDVFAKFNVPNRKSSSLDGIAFKFDNLSVKETKDWIEGKDYIFSNTGVCIDDQFDTVIRIEDVSFKDKKLIFLKNPDKRGRNINEIGSFIKEKELLVKAGNVIKGEHICLMCAAGVKKIEVLKKPVVAFIPTGNELIDAKMPMQEGKNIESNSLLFKAYMKEWGAKANIYPITPDDIEILKQTLLDAVNSSDIVILNGGSSKGTMDFTTKVFESLGEIVVSSLAHGPAKPTNFALINGKPVLGIVGPSIGAELTMKWYLKPLIEKFLKRPIEKPPVIKVTLMNDFRSPIDLDFYQQVVVVRQGERYLCYMPGINGQSMRISHVSQANAILKVPKETTLKNGEEAFVELKVGKEYIKQMPQWRPHE
ncbi:molybdopterin molybdotransferase MoeA [Campylobacter sp. RM16187]|uniref:molybdopterin molybdotransferase MoeA n=1 Tax=Campylobacter sp. RM16187 TaxID=1660063 RepID=UPI0021B4EE72|nr:molybdopterin molybdotransferase MoeA [Campylobacter sp. RM16187]QKG29955.1 molybdopterin molybdenumtransferase [Campylobacter sp. RM16187]